MNNKKKRILICICVIIIIVITIILCCSSFFRVIKLKNILNELDGKLTTIQNNNNNTYVINSNDGKRKIQINLSDKFKKLSNFDYSKPIFKYSVILSLDGKTPIGTIYINKDPEIFDEFNRNFNENKYSYINKIVYNNQKFIITSLPVFQALFTNDFPLALMSPIDSEYYYTIAFSSENNYNIEKEDFESLLNYKIIK